MKVYLIPRDGWAAKQIWLARLEKLGYSCVEWRQDGRSIIEITG